MAACEIPATVRKHRAFIGIYPPSDKSDRWLIRRFEVPERPVGQYFGEEDLKDNRYLRLETLEEVESVLVSWAVDPAIFDAPWKNDYPL